MIYKVEKTNVIAIWRDSNGSIHMHSNGDDNGSSAREMLRWAYAEKCAELHTNWPVELKELAEEIIQCEADYADGDDDDEEEEVEEYDED